MSGGPASTRGTAVLLSPRALRARFSLLCVLFATSIAIVVLPQPALAAGHSALTLQRGDGERLAHGSVRVRDLQRVFSELGYPLGRERGTGRFGPLTQGAVSYFQRHHGLTTTGRATVGTQQALARALGLLRVANRPPAGTGPPPHGPGPLTGRTPESLTLALALLLGLLVLAPRVTRAAWRRTAWTRVSRLAAGVVVMVLVVGAGLRLAPVAFVGALALLGCLLQLRVLMPTAVRRHLRIAARIPVSVAPGAA